MHSGDQNESSFCKKNKNGHTWDLLFFMGQKFHWLAQFLVHAKMNSKKQAINSITPFNFEKFHRVHSHWIHSAIYFL